MNEAETSGFKGRSSVPIQAGRRSEQIGLSRINDVHGAINRRGSAGPSGAVMSSSNDRTEHEIVVAHRLQSLIVYRLKEQRMSERKKCLRVSPGRLPLS